MDQDALNVFFVDNFLKLPVKFDHIFHFMREEKIEREIYHYLGNGCKPHPNFKDEIQKLWFKYFMRTPFFDMDSFGNLWNGFEDSFNNIRKNAIDRIDLWQKICKLSATRSRVFLTDPQNVDKIRESFGNDPRDIFLNATNQKAMDFLEQDLKNFSKERIYCIYTDDSTYRNLNKKIVDQGAECFDIRTLFDSLPELRNYVNQISKNI